MLKDYVATMEKDRVNVEFNLFKKKKEEYVIADWCMHNAYLHIEPIKMLQVTLCGSGQFVVG